MATMRGSRLAVGSSAWIAEERASALQIAESEVEEFGYSARNDFDWLNEHMAEIFNENEINVAEIFKTPGKLRGRTPRTARKANHPEVRVPLSDIFSATPNGATTSFAQQLSRLQSPKPNTQPNAAASRTKPASPQRPSFSQQLAQVTDSGYHGSQSQDIMDVDSREGLPHQKPERVAFHADATQNIPQSPTRTRTMQSPEHTFHTAREEQTTRTMPDLTQKLMSPIAESVADQSPSRTMPASPLPVSRPASPSKASTGKSSPIKSSPAKQSRRDYVDQDELRSPSDGSSPIRPVVRKSSLNFASLPAREPLNKSIGARTSRTSHLEHNRASYYSRPTGGKSLGNVHHDHDEEDDLDDVTVQQKVQDTADNLAANHNKTYTQRLQDQISKLGKSQPQASRPSKSVANLAASQQTPAVPQQPHAPEPMPASPELKHKTVTTPGAFPEDNEDDWIEPQAPTEPSKNIFSPRPAIPKSHSADIMEGIHNKNTVGGAEFVLPKQRLLDSRSTSPLRSQVQVPIIPERTTSTLSHTKSASVSVPVNPSFGLGPTAEDIRSPKKPISVSNPTISSMSEVSRPQTPSKSPSRTFRESPLKQVKNKLSSILKTSKGLLASSAAISAEGKSSMLTPSTAKLALAIGPAVESTLTLAEQLYPDLPKQLSGSDTQTISSTASPSRNVRRTRASVEREKEAKRKEKEAKLMTDQMGKLEKARKKEEEKARVFSQEQERVAIMEQQIAAQKEKKEREKAAAQKEPPKPTRTSPRKAKAQQEAEERAMAAVATPRRAVEGDVEMMDAPATMPPPPAPQSAGPSQASRGREIKRPTRPTKETISRTKAAPPTVIRVNTGSQHSQYHPSNNTLAANLHDTLTPAPSHHQLSSKASLASLKGKASMQSLKSSASSNGRPKALELAAKRREQEEREAQRKRDAKAELERKRVANQEEERRQEQQRRLEAERQKEKEREQVAQQAEAKKHAQRQAAIEKAKQTRAPPPATRSQPNGPPDHSRTQGNVAANTSAQRAEDVPPRPPSRLTSNIHRSHEELSRPVNAILSNATKGPGKRALAQDASEHGRNPQARNGATYQAQDSKRRRTSEEFDAAMELDNQPPNIKGPPVRPSAGFKKDMPAKTGIPSSYTNAPQSANRDLFKATVTAQHNSHVKAAHPLDMAQLSKGAIPFAPNPNPAGPAHKTPARPATATVKSAAKSAARSSPRFQNGDSIELPEIQTDDEDESEDDAGPGGTMAAAWTDSPDLRRALMRQETMDPGQIFGPPAPLVMEEVFAKSRDRWHKFRARTSSANWSGSDRLTEEDIRKDLAARDKMRREGGWSYELGRDMA